MTRLLAFVLIVSVAVGCKKQDKKDFAPAAKGGPPAQDQPAVAPGPGGGVVMGNGGGGGGGAAQAVRGAATRTVTNDDLTQIRTFIDYASGASGTMPTPQQTLAALEKEAPAIATKVKDGTITIPTARSRESIWAYETAAKTNGGLVATASGIERMDAATLTQKLSQ